MKWFSKKKKEPEEVKGNYLVMAQCNECGRTRRINPIDKVCPACGSSTHRTVVARHIYTRDEIGLILRTEVLKPYTDTKYGFL